MRFAALFLALLFTTMPASAYWIRDCKTDNVWSGQTKMVANINPGSADAVTTVFGFSHRHEHMIELNGTLYFQAANQSAGSELWRIKDDGLPAQVFDLATGSASSTPHAFVVFQNQLYFAASSPQTGEELYRLDGNSASLAAETVPGAQGAKLSALTVFGNAIYFLRSTENGSQLWRFNGSTAEAVTAVNSSPGSIDDGNIRPTPFAVLKNKLYFVKRTPLPDRLELWSFNGTTASKIKGLNGDDITEREINLGVYNNHLYFSVVSPKDDIFQKDELWRYDGQNAPVKVFTFAHNAHSFSQPADFVIFGDNLYFTAGSSLWRYDGSTLDELDSGPGQLPHGLHSMDLYPSANRLFFTGFYEDWTSTEPYLFDGATAMLLKNIMADDHDYPGSFPGRAVDVNGTLYFFAEDAANGRELWRTSGSNRVTLKCDIVVAPIWDDWRQWPVDRREIVIATWAVGPNDRRLISRETVTVTPDREVRVPVLELTGRVPQGFALATVVYDRQTGNVLERGYDVIGTPPARLRRQLQRNAAQAVRRGTLREAMAERIQRE